MKVKVQLGPSKKLLDLARLQIAIPYDEIAKHLCNSVPKARNLIAATFFATTAQSFNPNGIDWTTERDIFAQAYIAWQLSFHNTHGFNETVLGDKAYGVWAGFLATHGSTLGKDIFFETLLASGHWGPMCQNRQEILSDAAAVMTTRLFSETIAVPLARRSHGYAISLLLHMIRELDNEENCPTFNAVLRAFQKFFPSKLAPKQASWRLDFFNLSVASGINFWFGPDCKGMHFIQISSLLDFESISKGDELVHSQVAGSTPSLISHKNVIYGNLVADWLSSGHAGMFKSGTEPRNVILNKTPMSLSGCFAEGTMVDLIQREGNNSSMWALEKRPIEELQENDVIVGANGSTALVSDEKVMSTSNTEVRLYGINNETPFFTGGHMFWTTEGWKAVHPEAASTDNPHVSVGKLSVGDIVLRARSTSQEFESVNGVVTDWQYDSIVVSKIPSEDKPANTTVFAVHVREGVRSYHANGYLVAVNTPEITATSVARNIRTRLEPAEQVILLKELNANGEIWDKVLGAGSLAAVKTAMKRQRETVTTNTEQYSSTTRPGGKVRIQKRESPISIGESHGGWKPDHFHDHYIRCLKMSPKDGNKKCNEKLPDVSLIYGKLLLDHKPVEHAVIHENHVYWKRKLSQSKTELGALRLNPHGRLGSGALRYTEKKSASKDGTTVQVHVQSNDTTYLAKVEGESKPFYITMGHDKDPKTHLMTLSGSVYDYEEGEKLTQGSLVFTTPAPSYLLHFKCDQFSWISEFAYKAVDGTLSPDGKTFTGTVKTKDEKTINMTGTVVTTLTSPTGTSEEDTAEQGLTKSEERKHSKIMNLRMEEKKAPSSLLSTKVSEPSPPQLQESFGMLSDIDLNINALMALNPPDNKHLNEMGYNRMVSYAQYCMTDDERKLLNTNEPNNLSMDEINFLEGSPSVKDFLRKKMGFGYLSEGFLNSADMDSSWGDDLSTAKAKLPFFWNGASKSCLATDPEYNNVQQFAARVVFANLMIEMQPYLDPSNSPKMWAKTLYTSVMQKTTFNSLCDIAATHDYNRLNMYSMMLFALDPEKSYASNLYKSVSLGTLVPNVTNVDPSTLTAGFIQKSMANLVVHILSSPNDSVWGPLKDGLSQALAEQNIDSSKTHSQQAMRYVTNTAAMTGAMAQFIKSAASNHESLVQAVAESTGKVDEKKPSTMKKGGKMFARLAGLAALSYGMYRTVGTVMNWSKLSDEEKAESVFSMLTQSVQLCQTLGDLFVLFKEGVATVKEKMAAYKKSTEAINSDETRENVEEGTNDIAEKQDPKDEDITDSGQANISKNSAKEAAAAPSTYYQKWKKDLKVPEKIAEGLNILMMLTGTVTMGLQFATDVQNNAPTATQALDGLCFVVNVVSTVVAVSTFFAVGRAAVVLPCAGAVLSLIGVALDIILSIIGGSPKPKDTIQQTWVKQVGVGFVKTLPSPSAKFALSATKSAGRFNEVSDEDVWMAEIIHEAAADTSYVLSGDTKFSAGTKEGSIPVTYSCCEMGAGEGNRVTITPKKASDGSGTGAAVKIYLISNESLSSVKIRGVELWRWCGGKISWGEGDVVASFGWYIYCTSDYLKVDSDIDFAVESSVGFQLYTASANASDE